MMYITIGVIIFLVIFAIVLSAFGGVLEEFRDKFMYIMAAAILIIIGSAVYLSVAVPSFANTSFFGSDAGGTAVTQDNVIGLELREE